MGTHYTEFGERVAQRVEVLLLRRPCPRLPAAGTKRESLPCFFTKMVDATDGDPVLSRVVFSDSRVICFRDRRPCATHHLLVIPRQRIRDVLALRGTVCTCCKWRKLNLLQASWTQDEDVDLLKHMRAVGQHMLGEVLGEVHTYIHTD